MSEQREHIRGSVCVDCLIGLANGDWPEVGDDWTEDQKRHVNDGLTQYDWTLGHVAEEAHPDEECDEDMECSRTTFSWSRCESMQFVTRRITRRRDDMVPRPTQPRKLTMSEQLLNTNIHHPNINNIYRNGNGDLVISFGGDGGYRNALTMFASDLEIDRLINAVFALRQDERNARKAI